ncbi:MAG: radical SAM protein, partial [Deltaproteobacteria bacterium]|nr:radical SAM protein [Deltaproteobacteria bacterium]
VLNSCVVRQSAENRVVNKLSALKTLKKSHPNLTLAVTGCLVDSDVDQLRQAFPHVDYFFKPGEFPPWLEEDRIGSILPQSPSPCAFVPIIQGCNNFCAYCIVPYRRGREKSRPVSEIVSEVKELHPKDMSSRLITAIAHLDKVCEQINLPVQSGNDDILKAMKRDYTVDYYRQLINEIRSKVPEIALSTDVIVGFPSENQEQFQQTVGLLSELKFDTVHVAAYSPRPGTLAFRQCEDNVTPAEKKERLQKIEQLQEGIATEINARLLGKTVKVLVEGRKGGKWWGRTRSDKLVFFSGHGDFKGQLVEIRIEKTSPWSVQGKVELDNTN